MERAGLSTGNKQQGANAEQQQTEHHAAPIAEAVDEQSGRDGQQEVAQIGRHLDKRRLGDGDVQLVLEMLVQHVKDGARESP